MHWQRIVASSQNLPVDLSFATSTEGWGILQGGLLHTADGTVTWNSQSYGGSAALNAVSFLPAGMTGGNPRGWAVGTAGTIVSYGGGGTQPPHQCFLDVPPSHGHFTSIEGLCHAGLIEGYEVTGGSEFRPQSNLLRAQFAKMILGVLKITVTENDWLDSNKPFQDVEPANPSKLYPNDYIAVASRQGITKGAANPKNFQPYLDIKRSQVISMVVRAAQKFKAGAVKTPPAGWTGTLAATYYSDRDHGANLKIAEYNHLLDGLVGLGSSWDFYQKAGRAEAAQIMWNLYNAEGDGTGPQLLYSDDFSNPGSGWLLGEYPTYEVGYDTAVQRYTIC